MIANLKWNVLPTISEGFVHQIWQFFADIRFVSKEKI